MVRCLTLTTQIYPSLSNLNFMVINNTIFFEYFFSGTVNSDSQLATLSAERKVSETKKMLSQSLFNPSCGMVGPALGVYVL